MAWSYSGNPNSSDIDRIRFLSGDTDSNAPLLQDEEIEFLLSIQVSPTKAARAAVDAILVKLAQEVDYTIGPEKVSASQRFEQYRMVAKNLANLGDTIVAMPSWRDPMQESKPIFDIGMHDSVRRKRRGDLLG